MERIRTSTNTPTDPQGAGLYVAGANPAGYFTDGNPGVVDGTIVGALWLNQVQEEIINAILVDSAIVAAVDVTVDTQLATAIGALRALRSHATDTTSLSTTHTRALLACSNSRASGLRSAAIASESTTVVSGQSSAALGASAATCDGTQCVAIGSTTVTLSGIRSVAIGSSLCGSIPGSQDSALIACGTGVAVGDATSNNTCAIASIESAGTCAATGEQSLVAASDDGQATGDKSAVIACDTCTASGPESAAIASQSCSVEWEQTAAIASAGMIVSAPGASSLSSDTGTVSGAGACAIASSGAEVTGVNGMAMASANDAHSTGDRSVLMASLECELFTAGAIGGGATGVGIAAVPANANQEMTWRIESSDGEFFSDLAFNAGGADYAEMFPNVEPGAIGPGVILTRRGTGCQVASPGDRVLGIVSVNPTTVGNDRAMGWQGRHERDEWDRVVTVDREYVEWPRLVSEDDSARKAAASELDQATAEMGAAVLVRQGAGLQESDKRRWLVEPSEAFQAAAAKLVADGQPAGARRMKRWHKVPRLPENAPLFRVMDACYARVETADRDMRTHVAERMAAADRACALAMSRVEKARGDLRAAKLVVTVEREGYSGRLDRAPEPIPDDAKRWTRQVRIRPDGYDPSRPYLSRRDRPEEWTCVGLLGQIRVRVDATVKPDDFVVPGPGGIGTAAKKAAGGRSIECMEILHPHTEDRGCGIALCLVG